MLVYKKFLIIGHSVRTNIPLSYKSILEEKQSVRREGISPPTAAVQVSHFLKAKLLKNMGEPFRILPTKRIVFLLRRTAQNPFRGLLVRREGFEPSKPEGARFTV